MDVGTKFILGAGIATVIASMVLIALELHPIVDDAKTHRKFDEEYERKLRIAEAERKFLAKFQHN